MIFVTVGTHEQPFNRLIEEIDRLKQEGVITDEVQMQTGYCTYEPKCCKWEAFFPYKKMQELIMDENRTVVIVSHSTETLEKLCTSLLWLHEGEIKMQGDTKTVLDAYNEFMA